MYRYENLFHEIIFNISTRAASAGKSNDVPMEIILPPPPLLVGRIVKRLKVLTFIFLFVYCLLNVNHYFCFESSLPRSL